MRDDEDRPIRSEASMGITIHMYDIDVVTFRKLDQPIAAVCKIVTAVYHPFETVAALDKNGVV
jgi:hypothetical protein